MIPGLDRARWSVLSPYLDAALEMPAETRAAWLEALRRSDPALAADVEVLLADYGRVTDEDFLGTSPPPLATLAGMAIGAYTVRAPIGRGGMGSVWLAERSDGHYEGAVAVKLLNASLVGQGAEGRFRREGNILARLRHRHIAQLLDAGVSAAGQPYLVLELVDGEHIGVHCDRRRLGVTARVRLVLDVLSAVAHAHSNLIVHRDLKPANLLVDRDGVVKLLDFGVAKLLEVDADAGPAKPTLEGGGALTPEYAAPEQLDGGDVTTATDVFALGVLLYELLAGRHPFGAAPGARPGGLIRAILSGEPAPLSAEGAGQELAAHARGTTPDALRRALRGDLETIVMKALKKAPAERYASATALAADLRAWLAHVPISARPDTLRYRTAKFVRRHRLPVALAGVLALALAGGLAGMAWQAREAARERDLALAQLQRAESLNLFTEFLLTQAEPGGRPLSVREIVERGEHIAEKRAAHDPTLAVDLLVAIGGVYARLDEPDNTERTMKRAYELSQAVSDPATRAQAACGWARAAALKGDAPAGLRLVAEGLTFTSGDARFDVVVATCLLHRASIAMAIPSGQLVLDSARQALARLERRPGAYPELQATVLEVIATGQSQTGDRAAADRTYAQALDRLRLVGRGESSDAAVLLNNWAVNAAYTDPAGAVEKLRRALDLFGGVSSDAVPLAVLHVYAVQLNRLARYDEARPVLERAQALARQHGHATGLTRIALQMACTCTALGDLACTRASLRVADGGIAGFPPGDRARGDLLRQKALLASAEGHDADARRLLQEALVIHQAPSGENVAAVETLLELSRLELRQGSVADAEAHARTARELSEAFRGGAPRSSWVGRSLAALGAARLARGDAGGAHPLLAEAVEQMTPTLGPEHPDLARARRLLQR